MKNNETFELLIDRTFHSTKARKLTIMFLLTGIVICFILLLPPIKNTFISLIVAHRHITSDGFESKLRSLLSLSFLGLVIFVHIFCCLFSKTISAFLEDTKNERLIIVLTSVTSVLVLGFISIFSYQYGTQWLDSDHSSEMVLGKLLADENTFVSRNWYYSSEIRLIHQTIFIMPLFKLIGRYENWVLIRALVILFNNLVLILSYLFMARQMKIKTKWICITSLFLIMPVSLVYWDIVIFGGYYIFFIAQFFCCIGLYIRLTGSGTVKTTLIDFILFTALSFVLGVQGIRSLFCVHIPLLIVCIYLYSKMAQRKNFPLFLGCYGFVMCCIGFVVNYLLHFWYNFHSYNGEGFSNLYSEFSPKLGKSLVCLAEYFGFSIRSPLLSVKGLFSVISIIGTFILFWAIIKLFRYTKMQSDTIIQPMENQFMTIFFIVSVAFNIFVFIIVDEDITSRYFIPFMILYSPLVAILFEHVEKTCGHLKRITVVSGIVLFVFGQSCLNLQSIKGLDVNSARKGYIQYLLDNQLDYGFATFWNANVTTELTKGKTEMVGLNHFELPQEIRIFTWPIPKFWNANVTTRLTKGKMEMAGLNHSDYPQIRVFKWLIPEKFFNPSYHQKESFLLLTRAEWELAQEAGRSFALLNPDYEDNDFIIIKYPSAEIIYREVLDD